MKLAGFHAVALCAGFLMPVSPSSGADLDSNLIARWTFKDGSLKSEVGDFVFAEGGSGTIEAGTDSVTLRDRKFLMVPEISSAAFPDLVRSVTIWARLKFDTLPEEYEIGVMGLQDGAAAGDWPSLIFTLLYRALGKDAPQSGLAFLGQPQSGGELGVGAARFQPVTAGEFFNVAIVFNGETRTASMWVSSTGQAVESRIPGADRLKDFGGFGIGQLKAPGASSAITFDEVRIYSTALEPQWLEEIGPSQK